MLRQNINLCALDKRAISRPTGLLAALCLLTGVSSVASADSRMFAGYKYQAFQKLHQPDAELVPTSMMTDEQLYLTAETQRNASMPVTHQRANHFWLRSEQGDGYEGTAALRKFVTMSLANMYPELSYRGERYNLDEDPSSENYQESSYVIRNLENYSLRLSQSRVSLRFRYRF